MERFTFAFLLFLALVACTPDSPSKELLHQEVVDMLHQYHAAIKKSGLHAEFDYLDPSSDFFWVPPGYESALSYDSVRAILEGNAHMFEAIDFHWETLDVHILSPEIATYSGIVTGSMTDTSGVSSGVAILESGTLIKRADGWKLLSGQSVALESQPVD
ncbi:MAG: nuclear transport factor 2 family protein [Saprospiraceae bacterium]|nr:nuclear transport factor 2 family protein [Saprospiraceae bacterium]